MVAGVVGFEFDGRPQLFEGLGVTAAAEQVGGALPADAGVLPGGAVGEAVEVVPVGRLIHGSTPAAAAAGRPRPARGTRLSKVATAAPHRNRRNRRDAGRPPSRPTVA